MEELGFTVVLVSPKKVSVTQQPSLCSCWTSTTTWSWPGRSTTSSPPLPKSFPGPTARIPGTHLSVADPAGTWCPMPPSATSQLWGHRWLTPVSCVTWRLLNLVTSSTRWPTWPPMATLPCMQTRPLNTGSKYGACVLKLNPDKLHSEVLIIAGRHLRNVLVFPLAQTIPLARY